jgi:DNA-binding PadR family transcriptional regulator
MQPWFDRSRGVLRALLEEDPFTGHRPPHETGHHEEQAGERAGYRAGPPGPHGPRHGRGWGPFGGPPPWGPFGGPPGDRRRGGGPFGRGPKVRRGDVRAAALALLAEQPRNGYQIIQEIAERSNHYWRPSSGSVYPALQQLEDEGLIRADVQEGRRVYSLTDSGREYVEAHKEDLQAPWDVVTASVDDEARGLWQLVGQVGMALVQVSQVGTPAQVEQARQIMLNTRRSLYQLLAQEETESETETESSGETV